MATERVIRLVPKASHFRVEGNGLYDGPLRKPKSLEVILKITERCNIACSYCYFFDARNKDFDKRPPTISTSTVHRLASYLAEAADDFGLETVRVIIHGGEPLMYSKSKFREICSSLHLALDGRTSLQLSLQTNGMLLDTDWIALLDELEIQIGVSLDGDPATNDRHRVDHKGQGTYRRATDGLRALQTHGQRGFDVISVLGADGDAAAALRHFVEQLALTQAHFTVLDETHDTANETYLRGVSANLMALYGEWRRLSHRGVYVRTFNNLLASLLRGDRDMRALELAMEGYVSITVRSDGSVGPDDTFRNVLPELFDLGLCVQSSRLRDYLSLPEIRRMHDQLAALPDDCGACCWKRVCRAGLHVTGPLHRYSASAGFNNKNLHCDAIQQLLLTLAQDALQAGASLDLIREVLHDAEAA